MESDPHYYIQKLENTDTQLAQELIKVWQLDEGMEPPSIPSNQHIGKLIGKKDFHVWVARLEEQVVGGLTAYELTMFDSEINEIFLYEIGVVEQYRKQGIAKKLIECLKQMCLEQGIQTIFLATEMDNEAAKQLYASTGADVEVVPFYTYNLKKK